MSSSAPTSAFWPDFQQHWAALLCEQTEGLRAWSENQARMLADGALAVANIAEARAALDAMTARLARLNSVAGLALEPAMRDQFVRYGAALVDAPALPALALDYADVRGCIERLAHWLSALQLASARVYALDDADSQIIGRAVAARLKLRFAVGGGDELTAPDALIVAADSGLLTLPSLGTVFPGQVVYALNLQRESGTLSPDVAGLARAQLALPWHHERGPGAAEFAVRIANAPRDAADEDEIAWRSRLDFYVARRELLAAGNPSLPRLLMLPETP